MILIAACSPQTTIAPPPPTAPALITEDHNGLSAEEFTSLQSLEKVDDYPLYVMHYSGSYRRVEADFSWPPEHEFACSLFAALPQAGDMFYGRNFDWDFSPALLLFNNPPDGYASVSMVDLNFLGISSTAANSLTDLLIEERTALLSAPSMPFDGMNETGLTIGMAAVPEESTGSQVQFGVPDSYLSDAGYKPFKPTIGSIGIIREILDHAQTIDEAVQQFEKYNISFRGGPPIHYLIADIHGKAVLVEFFQGKRIVLPNEGSWHLATNHYRCIAQGDGGCPRYHALSARLTDTNGKMEEKAAFQLLSQVAQGSTQWSALYNMTSGAVSVVVGKSYGTVFRFPLEKGKP